MAALSNPPFSHAADLSEAAGSAEAEPQTQEGGGSFAGRLHHQKTVPVRLAEDPGKIDQRFSLVEWVVASRVVGYKHTHTNSH